MALPNVLSRIDALLDAPVFAGRAPTRPDVEQTLTDGYAHALALEAERLRLERRIGELVAALGAPGEPTGASAELVSLSNRLAAANGELERLRAVLATLRRRARDLRSAPRLSRSARRTPPPGSGSGSAAS